MPLDPYNTPTSPEAAVQQRIAELERRVAALERAPRIQAVTGTPAAPGDTVKTARGGEVTNTTRKAPAGGATVVDRAAAKTWFFDGTVWKYVAIT